MPPSTHLEVCLRQRPPQPHDRASATTGAAPPGLDHYFGPDSSQHAVFQTVVAPLLPSVLDGTPALIYAYGQTGAGKTYTMLGPSGGHIHGSDAGVLPRAASELFCMIARRMEEDGTSAYQLRASFLEVHCGHVYDLLADDGRRALQLREDSEGRVHAAGAAELPARSARELLRLVERGAAARATAPTGVHAHSSRSHAVLELTIERRWAAAAAHPAESGGGEATPAAAAAAASDAQRARVSRLTLVDLAGSEGMEGAHGGRADAAGVATNVGLLVLGRVLEARARGTLPPYRDAALTRLLQRQLDGGALTRMIACVGPLASSSSSRDGGGGGGGGGGGAAAAEGLATVRFALRARQVQTAPVRAATRAVPPPPDPMAGDVDDDEEPLLRRRCVWIAARGFGDVFARVCGEPTDPLVLYVHGSGPTNSSRWWSALIPDLARRSTAQRYFHVAIDCPGYGRSGGDRQTIRSCPDALVAAVLRALGRRSARLLVGSSQGAAAVLNAALCRPELSGLVAVCHPVTHAPERFGALRPPVLLVYDTDDDGHPVAVGRRLRRLLPRERVAYHEFSSVASPGWDAANMAPLLLQLLSHPSVATGRSGRLSERLPELVRVAGGLRGWQQGHNGEVEAWSADRCGVGGHRSSGRVVTSAPPVEAEAEEEEEAAEEAEATVVAEEPPPSSPSHGGRQILRSIAGNNNNTTRPYPHPPLPPPPPLPHRGCSADADADAYDEVSSDDEDGSASQQRRAAAAADAAAAEAAEREASQRACDRCQLPLLAPDSVRLAGCRCALCPCCVEATVLYTRACPVCGAAVAVDRRGRPKSDADALNARLEAAEGREATEVEATGVAEAVAAQRALLAERRSVRASCRRLVLEFGNSASSGGGKTTFVTTVRAVAVPTGAGNVGGLPSSLISRVDFDINPGVGARPTATVRACDVGRDGRFSFGHAMGRPFPCVMTIHLHEELRLPPIRLNYRNQAAAQTTRRLVVQIDRPPVTAANGSAPAARRRAVAAAPVAVDADPPRDGWLCFRRAGAPECWSV